MIYVLSNSSYVISGWWEGDNERLCAMEVRNFDLQSGLHPLWITCMYLKQLISEYNFLVSGNLLSDISSLL